MNNERLTQSATEEEYKTLDAVIHILLIFIFGLFAFSFGYLIAMSEVAALVKTILN
jgi:hypothetical protein